MAISAEQTRPLAFPVQMPRLGADWAKLAVLLTIGYLSVGRSFAYLGLPWFDLYIAELSLAAFLFFGPRTNTGPWLQIARRMKRLRRLKWLLFLLLSYGVFAALHGILKGYPAFTAARDTAFNYYPLYLFLGIWVGLTNKDVLRRLVRALAWFNGIYGLAYVLFLNWLPWAMPGTVHASSKVPLFTEPYNGSAIALLGLIALEPRLRKVWYLVAANAFVLLGLQVRAEWVAFAVGLVMFAWLTKRIKKLAAAAGLIVLLLAVMFFARLSLPSPKNRGGKIGTKISVDYLVARAVAPLNRSLAAQVAPGSDVRFATSTAEWRLVWWANIWERVNADKSSALLGFGYGYPIGRLNPLIPAGDFIQTPHNDLFYVLAFSGWVGVVLFGLFQLELLRLLWRAYKTTGLPLGLMCWAAFLAASLFEDFFEAPFGAVPFYLMIGIALAPALLRRGSRPGRPVSLATGEAH